jgi:hypothetical protein
VDQKPQPQHPERKVASRGGQGAHAAAITVNDFNAALYSPYSATDGAGEDLRREGVVRHRRAHGTCIHSCNLYLSSGS